MNLNIACTRSWCSTIGLVGTALLTLSACAGPEQSSGLPRSNFVPRYSGGGIGGTVSVEGNGPGQCLLADTQQAGFLSSGAQDLNCTSNELSIDTQISEFSVNGGTFVPFTNVAISCNGGDIVRVVTSAVVTQRASSPRLDVGIWVNPFGGGDALTGQSCLQYTLTADQGITADFDQCGDLTGGVTLVPLDTVLFSCPASGATSIPVSTCAAWSQPGSDRQCPASPPGGSLGFRLGTTPGGKSKCSCDTIDIPVQPVTIIGLAAEPSRRGGL
jgi:hypothetical protein